jgi:zinc transport system substrate-binding protein
MIYHPAFGYFAREYNLTQLAVEHAGKEPTPQIIENCIKMANQYSLQYIFTTPQVSTEYCETIANAINARIATINPLAKNYISNLAYITDMLSSEFEK